MKIFVSAFLLLIGIVINGCGSSKSLTGEKKNRTKKQKTAKPNYPHEVADLTELIQKNPNNVKAYVDRGNAYYAISDYTKAEQDFIKALELNPDFSDKVHLYKATVQRLQNKHSMAADSYSKYLETCDPKEASCKRAFNFQRQASFTAEAIKNPVDFNPVLLSENINNEHSQYLPHFTIDGKKMIYTERARRQEDLFESNYKDGVFSKGKPIIDLNTTGNEGAHCITPDGRHIIFTICDNHRTYGSCDLFGSVQTERGWTKPKNLGKKINSEAWDSQPSLSGDGKKLYFSSKRSGGHGGADLYVASWTAEGWGDVTNLGESVNSNGDDESPFLHQDNQTLYFRSNGHLGMGGYDIFVSRRANLNEEFGDVKNIGYPINSEGDEGGLYVSLDGSTGYFASDKSFFADSNHKPTDKTTTDIYSFEIPVSAKPRPVSYFKASIIDGNTQKAIAAKIKITELNNSQEYLTTKVKAGKELLVPIPTGNNYSIVVEKDGYLYHSENFALDTNYAATKPFEKVISIYPIPKATHEEVVAESKPIVLNNIFWETGSATLKPESNFEIDNLANQLNENTNLKIKIIGHTDNVGSEADNLKLSEARAKAIYDALILRSIPSSRLSYEGKGESQPVADNDTLQGRQKNRRTEFVVIGV